MIHGQVQGQVWYIFQAKAVPMARGVGDWLTPSWCIVYNLSDGY